LPSVANISLPTSMHVFPFATVMVALAIGVGPDTKIELRRCADAKAQNPELLAVVVIVSSHAREFTARTKLRQTQFQKAQSLHSRALFRPSKKSTGVISLETTRDSRPVCVQPIFVLSPWLEIRGTRSKIIRQDEWRKIIAESKEHHDVLIAPTITDSHTRGRELMHVLEWSRQTAPWADYIVSSKSRVSINWPRMIEIFPPPTPRKRSSHALWLLANSAPSTDPLFWRDPHVSSWRQCADLGAAAFSRDLVREMTGMSFATQILHALRHPLRIRCKLGTLDETRMLGRLLA